MPGSIIIFLVFIFFSSYIPLYKLGKREREDGYDDYKALCHLDVGVLWPIYSLPSESTFSNAEIFFLHNFHYAMFPFRNISRGKKIRTLGGEQGNRREKICFREGCY